MRTGDGKADVFIYKYIKEIEMGIDTEPPEEQLTCPSYLHYFNSFTVDESEITEDMIKENPEAWLNYVPKVEEEKKVTDSDRLDALESAILEIAEVVYNG